MAKFISHDGVDKNGIRAEVTVMTGTGVIAEIIGRGKQNEDGSYRNVEIVFTPDNPLLKRKVYGLLDTTATDLWAFVQEAHQTGRNITYRIESQRRNGVDRTKPIGDLVPTEDVRRILAAVDNHFSHEAKTNPAEDPDNENPSALTQPVTPTAAPGAAAPVDVAALAAAVAAALGNTTPTAASDTTALFAPDGRLNYGSAGVARAARAEQFALDHLLTVYTPAKGKTPEVSDEILAQAGSLAHHLLTLADRVHHGMTGTTLNPDASRNLALDLVIDAVNLRHPAPLGTDTNTQTEWADAVVDEAADRFHGIGMLAQGQIPTPRPETTPETGNETGTVEVIDEPTLLDESTNVDTEDASNDWPREGDDGFIAPDDTLIGRVRALCETAHVLDHPKEISDWMEDKLGSRSARKVHALALAEFVLKYEAAGPDQVRTEIQSYAA